MGYIGQKLSDILGKNYGIYYGIYWAKTMEYVRLKLWVYLGIYWGKLWDILGNNYWIY